jgi:hypothetical protein
LSQLPATFTLCVFFGEASAAILSMNRGTPHERAGGSRSARNSIFEEERT